MTSKLARLAAITTVPVFVLAVAACSSTSGTSNGSSSSASASSSASPSLKTTNLTANDVTVTGAGANMAVEFPFPSSASALSQKDVKVGTGASAKLGSVITVNYYLAGALTGQKIESSFGAQPAQFPLEEGGLIQGWIQGIPGMKVGGERVLVIPGNLAYGPQGKAPQIGPDETLVFVVQLVKIG